MFTTRWRLFRLAGIPIYIDASWLIILALFTAWFREVYQHALYGPGPMGRWGLGLLTSLAYFACIVLHELGHAVVARRYGMPIRGITLFLFGGVAELGSEPPSASSEFLMAIGGPVVSALLAGVLFALYLIGLQGNWAPAGLAMLHCLWLVNLVVLIFNLVPAFPLDGGRVLRSSLWAATGDLHRATYWASLCGRGFAWFLMGMGVLLFILGDWINGVWTAVMGLFLNNAARGSYEQVLIREALAGEPVGRFMNREPVVVPPGLDLRTWVEDYVYRYHRKTFPVVHEGRLEGVVSTAALAQYPRESWPQHTVGELMRRDLASVCVTPQTDAMEALSRMQATGSSRLLVVEGERLLGILSIKDLLRFLQLKLQLEGPGRRPAPPAPPSEGITRDEPSAPALWQDPSRGIQR
jgi:Zn-dependent protease/CBS domain-containing protein